MLNAFIIMLIIGAILGGLLALASKVFHVEVDEREEKVTAMLPGYNCGACGYPGCSALAHGLCSGEVNTFNCKVTKEDRKKEIIEYLATTPDGSGKTVVIK